MNYIVTQNKQFGIDAESQEEAIKSIMNGGGDLITFAINATVRPMPQQPVRPSANISSGITVTPATKP